MVSAMMADQQCDLPRLPKCLLPPTDEVGVPTHPTAGQMLGRGGDGPRAAQSTSSGG